MEEEKKETVNEELLHEIIELLAKHNMSAFDTGDAATGGMNRQ